MRALGKLATAAAAVSLGVALGAAPAGALVPLPFLDGSGLGDDLGVNLDDATGAVDEFTEAVDGEVKVDPEGLAGDTVEGEGEAPGGQVAPEVLGEIPREDVKKLMDAGLAEAVDTASGAAADNPAPAPAQNLPMAPDPISGLLSGAGLLGGGSGPLSGLGL